MGMSTKQALQHIGYLKEQSIWDNEQRSDMTVLENEIRKIAEIKKRMKVPLKLVRTLAANDLKKEMAKFHASTELLLGFKKAIAGPGMPPNKKSEKDIDDAAQACQQLYGELDAFCRQLITMITKITKANDAGA